MTARLRIPHFSLQHTLESGQFFRFTKTRDTYIVQSLDRIFSVRQKGEFVFYEGVEEPFLIHFFRLEDDLDSIYKGIDVDPIIHRAIETYRGMRLIRQDPWECLISFLCSSAKAIPHIRSIVEMLCRSCGKRVFLNSHISYGFPKPDCINNPRQLEPVRAGFRTNYLLKASQCIDRRKLVSLKSLSHKEAREQLMTLSGVGKKVADCTLLYSLDFLEAFPMDTWIKKGLQKIYFRGKKTGERAMEEFVFNHFGPYAGYAQLYLFYYWRNNPF
jgi:N-glycosylase/DNA lyase